MSVRLFIAEDTDHVRQMLVDILGLHGFEVVGQAANGHEAVSEVDRSDPDVVILDLRMPGLNGLEAARQIREQRPDQVVILYSAYVDDDLQASAREVGVAVCIPKIAGVEALAREITAAAMDLSR
jgi:DNA-binding NarL/FixJ family response regulator